MAAKTMDLLVEQGSTFELDFTWADSALADDGTSTQVPKDLTGCAARMQIRSGYGAPVMLEASTENGRILLGADTGRVRVLLDAALTDAAPIYFTPSGASRVRGRAKYDLEVTFPDGTVNRVLEGRVRFIPNITRDDDAG